MKKIILLSLYCCNIYASQLQPHSFAPSSEIITLTSPKQNLENISYPEVKLGGFGGNTRIGQLIYSGEANTLPALSIERNALKGQCYLKNKNVVITNIDDQLINFTCIDKDPEHHDLYWDANLGEINGGFSPENDALYAGDVITNMFNDWYHLPPIKDENGSPSPIQIALHYSSDNAWLGNNVLMLGDGGETFYPLTSMSVISYFVGQVFTDQHSQLNWYSDISGGINIAFSCMTAMAAEFYATGKNTWQVGADVMKNNKVLHFMDMPSKNCGMGLTCDIDTLAEFNNSTMNYESSGLFNRAFYTLATTTGWDTHKAYDVFVQANRFHWKSNTGFHQGACDAVTSAKELHYKVRDVMLAFSVVGIDTRDC